MQVMAGNGKIIAVIGPTASGKSDLAVRIARQMGGEILSVDSMTVYREMDIGTAKPSAQERALVAHHLVDVVDPNETFTVAQFVERADAIIADAKSRGVSLVATGGTPLYYKALFEGLFEGPSADAELRRKLAERPAEELHQRLSQIDPEAASRIHVNDRKRMIRALEVYELTGQSISSLQREWGGAARHQATWYGLISEKEVLNRRINARVKAMIDAGWLDEVRGLLKKYGQLSKTAAEATGYRELLDHIQGRISLSDAIEQIKIGTRQLARRQMKWFRRFPGVRWIDASNASDLDAVVRSITQEEA